MRKDKIEITAGAALLFSALYFICDWDTILILALAIFVHELGHFAALRLMGARVRGLRVSLCGLCISYSGRLSYINHLLAVLAGPALGLLAALSAAILAQRLESATLETFAGVSVLLSGFNLLPALPLDGGRALAMLALAANINADRLLELVGLVTGTALLAVGLLFLRQGRGFALFIAAIWILMSQSGLVKKAGVL